MANIGPSRISVLCSLLVCAVGWLAAMPARVLTFVAERVLEALRVADPRAITDLLRVPPTLALSGGPPNEIGSALYQRNRHEAGLARLGAVRHI